MRRAWCLQLLGIICLCLLPRLALADAAQARVHFERGRTFFEVDEYRKAIAEFKAAHIEKPDPAFLYNIAECHRRLGEAGDALVYYRRFLSTSAPADKTRPIVEQRIAELKTVADDPKPPAADAPPAGAPRPGAERPVRERRCGRGGDRQARVRAGRAGAAVLHAPVVPRDRGRHPGRERDRDLGAVAHA